MERAEFKTGITRLERLGRRKRVVVMCAETLWWRCHRALISDYLKAAGYTVRHILALNKVQEHPFTSAARLVDGRLSYDGSEESGNVSRSGRDGRKTVGRLNAG